MSVDNEVVGSIGTGLLVLLGVKVGDIDADADWIARKCVGLRVFQDDRGRMNRAVTDVDGALLIVSQFTLYGDVGKGRRPGFDRAADPTEAKRLYRRVIDLCRPYCPVATGRFQATMRVSLVNEGPVTLLIDSDERGRST